MAVHLQAVTKTYGERELAVHALRELDLDIRPEEFVVLLGPSGSGKTTMLNVIGGIEPPSSGSVTVGGRDVSDLDEEGRTRFRRETVGFIFQFFNLIPTLTALENVQLIAELVGAEERAEEMLQRVGLGDRFDHFPAQLSGGEQQRVAVARALAGGPRILLGDEPTGALDLETGRRVLSLLHAVSHELNQTVLLVTHNAAIAQMADRVLRMRDGRIVSDERNPEPLDAEQLEW
ncbi:MAG: ABC transporter ATP-binding protein [Solirubrobacterales bacterium]|nr:MAG: ABC transporter ATP-binding protein [Solirubrobacterales bacterium]